MPYVKIELTDGATKAQKVELYKGITDLLVRVLGKNPEYTFIVIDEISTDNWGHKGTSVTELRKGDPAMRPKPPAKAAAPKVAVAKSAPKPAKAAAPKVAAVKVSAMPAKAPARPSSKATPKAPAKKGPTRKA